MRRLLAALLLLVLAAAGASADERIIRFVSDVTVNPDASVDVTETIAVRAEGIEIRRGIYRDFPTAYRDRHGTRLKVGFEVREVTKNGESEPYAVEGLSNGKRVRIGDADIFLAAGVYTYRITYRTTRQLGFFDTFDEFYWNVTGNGWAFPIDEAMANVRLPAGASVQQYAAYTGPAGSTGKDFRIIEASGNRFSAATTRLLHPSEGFTIAVAWQKGIVAAPTDADRRMWWLGDNAGIMALAFSLLLSLGYYVYAWTKVGRDPPEGTIIPLFAPPVGMGPAGARFIRRQSFDNRCFASALVGLAVKKRLRISDDGDDFSIEKTNDAGPALTAAETALYRAVPSGATKLIQKNHATVRPMLRALEGALTREFEGSLFVRNLWWFVAGAVVSVAGLVFAALFLPAEDSIAGLFTAGWSGIWWGVVLTFAWSAVKGLMGGGGILDRLGSVLLLMFLIPFFFGGVAAPAAILFGGGGSTELFMLIGTAVLLGLINLVFFRLLRAPTSQGRKILDQIEGFRMYMTTAEEERLRVLHPPEKTPELFERYLPFALALDCENEWNEKFAAVLAAAAAAGAAAGPSWYSGSNWNARDMGSFTDSLGSGLASSVASASTAPGSSSGSGGGGSSGGGGGGGGGGGW